MIEEAKLICKQIYCRRRDRPLAFRCWVKLADDQFYKSGVHVNWKLKEIKDHGCGWTSDPKKVKGKSGRWQAKCDPDFLCVHCCATFCGSHQIGRPQN